MQDSYSAQSTAAQPELAQVFQHQPRPPGIPGSIPDKRDYLAHHAGDKPSNFLQACGTTDDLPCSLIVRVNRYSPRGMATVAIATVDCAMWAGAALTPSALRELARMCIDAAHDIEVNP